MGGLHPEGLDAEPGHRPYGCLGIATRSVLATEDEARRTSAFQSLGTEMGSSIGASGCRVNMAQAHAAISGEQSW
ncbi:MAG: hypothetical protein ACLQRH_09155 [Acidimicrobiales bacterium]